MSTSSNQWFEHPFQIWCGLIVGVCVVIPPFLRLEEEGWTGLNIFLVIAGSALTIFWAAQGLRRMRRSRMRSMNTNDSTARNDGSSS